MTAQSPLGRPTTQPQQYSPESLCPISRAESRSMLGLAEPMPFHGTDLWNAWELTWLAPSGLPRVATAEIRVPADSPNIIESKSMKLYLASFTMTHQASVDDVHTVIARDLGECAGLAVDVRLTSVVDTDRRHTEPLPGDSLDDNDVDCDAWHVDADLLHADPDTVVTETLHSDLLRSLCPVTGQPDSGSVLIRYRGPRIERAALTRYIVSYRQHSDFHENCVERMFVDIADRCRPQELTVYARFQRRGGIDINPFRSNFEQDPPNSRLWRQ